MALATYTLTNLLTNSSFENAGWNVSSSCTIAYTTAYRHSGDYSLQCNSTSSSESLIVTADTIPLVQNHIYYVSVQFFEKTNVCSMMQVYWPIAEPVFGSAYVNTSKLNTWQKLSWRNSRTNWSSGNYQFRFDFEGMAANTSAYIDSAVLVDLTATFGSGNEPSQSWCDVNIPYFSGTLEKKYDLSTASDYFVGDILNYTYTGTVQSVTLPAGYYKLECWGAQGGSYSSYYGGLGGYSYGALSLTEATTLYLYAGGQPATNTTSQSMSAGGFNGGGQGAVRYWSSTYSYGQGGGGASDIRIGTDSLYARVIVAGGGGGSSSVNASTTKYGGGANGGSPVSGFAGSSTSSGTGGSFGVGASTYSSRLNYKYGSGGGGGGWYGGGAGNSSSYVDDSTSNYRNYNGGGSGYVYTSSTASNYPSGCLLNSSYYLTNAATVAGNTSFIDYSGSTVTGHSGNGACRITILDLLTDNETNYSDKIFIKKATTSLPSSYSRLDYVETSGAQYLQTEFIPNGNTRINMKIELKSVSGNQGLFAARSAAQSTISDSCTAFLISNNFRRDYYGTSQTSSATYAVGDVLTIICNKNVTKINNSSVIEDFTLSSTTSPMPLVLFASAYYSNSTITGFDNYSKIKIYSCSIYDNGTLKYNFIPCLLNSSGTAGFYDTINEQFLPSSSSTGFIAGPEYCQKNIDKLYVKTTDSAWKEAEKIYLKNQFQCVACTYIQSSGTQYINTGVLVDSNTGFEATFELLNGHSSSPYYNLFGVRGNDSAGGTAENQNYFRIDTIPVDSATGTELKWGTTVYNSGITGTGKVTISLKNKVYTKPDGSTISLSGDITQREYPLYLFCINKLGTAYGNFASMRLYSFKVYNGSTLIRNFLPVRRVFDDKYGLFDTINNKFYLSEGAEDFLPPISSASTSEVDTYAVRYSYEDWIEIG